MRFCPPEKYRLAKILDLKIFNETNVKSIIYQKY